MNCLKEFNAKTNVLMEKLRTYADGTTEVVLFKEINRMTLDIISSVSVFIRESKQGSNFKHRDG